MSFGGAFGTLNASSQAGSSFGGLGATAQAGAVNPNKDIEVASPPGDTVSSLLFSPTANHLVATSWDKQVRCWEVQQNGSTVPKAAITLDQPVLCADWSPDGSTVFAGGCDNTVKMWNLQSNQQQQVAKHDAPVRHCKLVKDMNNMLITGSWDRTIRYWDLRQPNPVHTQQLPERVYAMDAVFPVLVVGLADAGRKIQVYNLNNPTQPHKEMESPLKYQTRCITCFPDHSGFLVGSCEGRMAVQHVDDAQATKNFTFKCHRDGNDVYPVNSMAFHPQHGTFCSAGSDGTFNFWDKESKHRLKAMARYNQPITAGCFNHDGAIYAYSTSYDWGKGHAEHNAAQAKTYIFLHGCQDSEVKGRKPTSRR